MRRQTNPYRIERIGLLMKYKCFDADHALLNEFTVRGKVAIKEIEGVTERLNSIQSDITKWDAIDKTKELKEYYQSVDEDNTKNNEN